MEKGYLHGAYGQTIANSDKVSAQSKTAPIYVGTAPVHTIADGKKNINEPILVTSFAEAARLFGYSEDWASYTLCEAMYAHFSLNGIAPLILINCLNVEACKDSIGKTVNDTPVNGRIVISDAGDAILDSVVVGALVKGTDYNIGYDYATNQIIISQTVPGSLGTSELAIAYDVVDPSKVTVADIKGNTDGEGYTTGLHVIKDVYQATGFIPSMLLAPGFSCDPDVHKEMLALSEKVNGHWDLFLYVDIPLLDGATKITMETAYTWKVAKGYTAVNEKVFFPKCIGTDGRIYHISVLACANKQVLDAAANGVPYQSSSNTAAPVIRNLYFGDSDKELRIDDATINEKLNKNGIASAAYTGGKWVVWGTHVGQYDQENANKTNVFETTMLMLYYISNDFQHRRAKEVDQPMTKNRISQIVAEERTRIDALVSTGALIYGAVYLATSGNDVADMQNGDFKIKFDVTTTPLCKSMTALVNWTDKGFETYFAEGE